MMKNVQGSGVDPQTFVQWMRSAERNPADYPDPKAARLVEILDHQLIEAVEERQMQPMEAINALDDWVTESSEDFEETHDLEGGWLDTAENNSSPDKSGGQK